MKKGSFKLLFSAFLIALALASCGSPDNDPAVAAGVLTGTTVTGASSKAIAPKTISGTASFSDSEHESGADGSVFKAAFALDCTVNYNGDTYTVKGALNYATSIDAIGSSGSFTAYFYSPDGVTITGPEYEGKVAVDLKEEITYSSNGGIYSLNVTVEGRVDGTRINETTSFTCGL